MGRKPAKRKWEPKPGAQFGKKDAQVIGERIFEDLSPKLGRTPTTAEIIEDAEPTDSPLHKFFEWNNSKAANAHRKQQARHLCNHIYEVPIDYRTQKPVRIDALISIRKMDKDGGLLSQRAYLPAETVGKTELYRLQVVQFVLGRIEHWTKKYEQYEELEPIAESIRRVREAVDAQIRRQEKKASSKKKSAKKKAKKKTKKKAKKKTAKKAAKKKPTKKRRKKGR